jgi:hypothetical protein
MQMFKFLAAGMAVMLMIPTGAQAVASCEAPAKPDLPNNGAALSASELDAAANQVTGYSTATKAYLSCLDSVISTRDKYSRDEWRAALKAYNAVAPGVEEVWDTYQKLSEDWVKGHLAASNTAKK